MQHHVITSDAQDIRFMQFALQLAEQTNGQTGANPPVGAVLVKSNRILGFGAHLQQGQAHAEIHAIDMALRANSIGSNDNITKQKLLTDTTLYVTLEPCSHHGKTPPCVDAIIQAGISRVVVATQDVNPQVSGAGIQALLAHNIQVDVGVEFERASQLYRTFFRTQFTQRSYVILKTASSLDGKLATGKGESQWITCQASRESVHQIRANADAVLTGIGTVLVDDPLLTARLPYRTEQPARIILDRQGRIPFESQIVFSASLIPTYLFGNYTEAQTALLSEKGCLIYAYTDLQTILTFCLTLGFGRILVEAGPTLITSLLKENLVDEWILFQSPRLFGSSHFASDQTMHNVQTAATTTILTTAKATAATTEQAVFSSPHYPSLSSNHALFQACCDLPIEQIPLFEVKSVEKVGTDIKTVLLYPEEQAMRSAID